MKAWEVLTLSGKNKFSITTLKNSLVVSSKVKLTYKLTVSLLGTDNLEI